MNGSLFPALTDANSAHVLHRWIAVIVGLIVAIVLVAAWRMRPGNPRIVRLALLAAAMFPIQAIVGGLQILTGLSGWTQTLHLALGAAIWALLVALVSVSYLESRTALREPATGGGAPVSGARTTTRPAPGPAATRSAPTSR